MGFSVKFNCNDCMFPVKFGSINVVHEGSSSSYEDYTGTYDVTPMITSQRLGTKDKHMVDDVLVRTIPTREAANEAGGVTFIIGG